LLADKYFRQVLCAALGVGSVSGYVPPHRNDVHLWTTAEKTLMLADFKKVHGRAEQLARGAPVLFVQHDIGTFEDKNSYNAVAASLVKLDWTGIVTYCLGVNHLPDGKTDDQVADDVKGTVNTATGDECAVAVASMNQDRAATGVAEKLGIDVDTCDLHQENAIGRRALGDITYVS